MRGRRRVLAAPWVLVIASCRAPEPAAPGAPVIVDATAVTAPEAPEAPLDGGGTAPAGSAAEGRRGVVDPQPIGRIVQVTATPRGSELVIDIGADRGLAAGHWRGAVLGDGSDAAMTLGTVALTQILPRTSIGLVALAPAALHAQMGVRFERGEIDARDLCLLGLATCNPPPRTGPLHAAVIGRVIQDQVDGDGVAITIAAGLDAGVGLDWSGTLLRGDSDAPFSGGELVLVRVGKRTTIARTRLAPDAILANPRARLSPPAHP